MLPSDVEIQKIIRKEAEKGMAVAELEYLGLSLRIINTLEDKVKIIYMKQLIDKSEAYLLEFDQLGTGAIKEIKVAIGRISELEKEKKRWNTGSERTEYYKTRINTRAILA